MCSLLLTLMLSIVASHGFLSPSLLGARRAARIVKTRGALMSSLYMNAAKGAISPSTAAASTGFKTLQIGITGSIGMGKTTISHILRDLGFPVFDADACVHTLYSKDGKAVSSIERLYPDVIVDGSVDRKLLGGKVLGDSDAMRALENIVHPLVKEEREMFYTMKSEQGHFMVIYDIPLLFENPGQVSIDYSIVVSASGSIQKERVLQRPGMSEEKFESILSKQMPDETKRELADFVINTDSTDLTLAKSQVAQVIETMIGNEPSRWASWKSFAPESSSSSLKENYDAVVFDLDDTLCPVMGPIGEALKVLDTCLQERMPLTYTALGADYSYKLRDMMREVAAHEPFLSHDLTALRKLALRRLSSPEEKELVDDCVDTFVKARSHVDNHLYDDVIECFEWLHSQQIRIGVLTNGNANLRDRDIDMNIQKYLDPSLILNSSDVGVLKPSPVGFMAIAQRGNIRPGRVLFVGDSVEKDALASINSGMHGVYLDRNGDSREDGDSNYIYMNSLRPAEFEEKVQSFIQNRINY